MTDQPPKPRRGRPPIRPNVPRPPATFGDFLREGLEVGDVSNIEPYLGAIVHFRRGTVRQRCLAAIVTEVQGPQGFVALQVFAPPGNQLTAVPVSGAEHNGQGEYTWHWGHECGG